MNAVSHAEAPTGHRTYRYLSLGLGLIVVSLFVGVGVQIVASGGVVLPSISHYFYTPAHNVFVASLVAASLALVALSGRGLETILLDIAAVFAPIIALVPTGVSAQDLKLITGHEDNTTPQALLDPVVLVFQPGANGVPKGPCSPTKPASCVPNTYMDAVYNGVLTYAIVTLLVVVLSVLVIHRPWSKEFRSKLAGRNLRVKLVAISVAPLIGVLTALLILNLAFGSTARDFPFNGPGIPSVHFGATIAFFVTFTAVPIVNLIRYRRTPKAKDGRRVPLEGGAAPTRFHGVVYWAVPVLMILDIAFLFWMFFADAKGYEVLAGEAIALSLFAFFWFAQTGLKWYETNPRVLPDVVPNAAAR